MRRQPIWVFVFAVVCTFSGCLCNFSFDGKCYKSDHLGCCEDDSDCSTLLNHRYCVKSAASSLCFDCRNDDDCRSSAPICDAKTYTCRQCNPDRERCPCNENKRCGSGPRARVCLLDKGYCVGCESESDCRQLFSGGPHCNTDTQQCEACPAEGCSCTSDSDCAYATDIGLCLDGVCVRCNRDEDCPLTQTCDEKTHSCQSGCRADADCPSETPVCKEGTGLCVECVDDGDCLAERPYCDSSTNTCQRCLPRSDDCNHGRYCAQSGQGYDCVPGCKNDDDCVPIVSPPDLGAGDGAESETGADLDAGDGDVRLDAGPHDAVFPGDAGVGRADMAGSSVPPPARRCDVIRRQCVDCLVDDDCQLGEVCQSGDCCEHAIGDGGSLCH